MCDKPANNCPFVFSFSPFVFYFIPGSYKTQKLCNKAFSEDLLLS